jgi:CO/xanthine dehydrogenase Mo-binding subunit
MVRRGDFVGVVAEREYDAIRAAKALEVEWTKSEILYDERTQFADLRRAPVLQEQTNFNSGDVCAAIARGKRVLKADYNFAYQLHAILGPSCAIADVTRDAATVWSGTQWPHGLRGDLAQMLGLPLEQVRVIWREASGSYGRLGCDDAAGDAALMSQIVGKPVRVQWTREEEHGWEPVAAGATITVEAALGADGKLEAFDYVQWSSTHDNSERGNLLAWKLIGTAPGYDRLTGNIYNLPYDVAHKRGRSIFVEPTFRTIYLRGPGSVQSHFATETLMDELAEAAGVDPIEFRARYLADRDRAVLQAVAQLAQWTPRTKPPRPANAPVLRGRGMAFARYGLRDTLAAIVADVEVERESGRVRVTRVHVAQDCGFMVNPDGVLNQVQGNIIHAVSRALKEELHYTHAHVTTLNWDQYEVLRFNEIPEIKVELIQRTDLPPSVVGEIASVPTPAAIANAIYEATGRRIREAPFTPARIKALLAGQPSRHVA